MATKGSIPAGLPAMQEQEPVDRLGVDPSIFGLKRWKPHQVWALRVSGDSMVDAAILDGDLVVLERREPRPLDCGLQRNIASRGPRTSSRPWSTRRRPR